MSGITDSITAQIPYRYKNARFPAAAMSRALFFTKKCPEYFMRERISEVFTDICMMNRGGKAL